MEPPEPTCPRCKEYILDEDMDAGKCSYCGWVFGQEYNCDGCGKPIHPSNREGLCRDCRFEEEYLQGLDEGYMEEIE